MGPHKAVRIGFFGDLGQTHYSVQTLERLAAQQPDIIFNMGARTGRQTAGSLFYSLEICQSSNL